MLELYFFNVKHGDSIAIHFPNGEWGIMDSNICDGQVMPNVLEFLIKKNVERLNFICVTHPHRDHFDGIDAIAEYYKEKIDKFILFDIGLCSEFAKKESPLMKALRIFMSCRQKWQKPIRAAGREEININGFKVKILNPKLETGEEVFAKYFSEEDRPIFNRLSVVMHFEYGGRQILLNADVPKKECEDFLNKHEISADVVKISHHGSIHNNPNNILISMNNKKCISIISSDGNKSYKLVPHPEVLNCLENNINSNVLKTYELGERILPEQELETVDMIDGMSEIADEPVTDGYFKVSISEHGDIVCDKILNI